MSEDPLTQAPEGAGSATPAPASAGELLRAAREAAGLHVAALAVAMKVPVKKLEALEADRFDLLPDAVFVRALASSVCRNLKIDPAPVLSRLPHQDVPRLSTPEHGINAPFHAAGEKRNLSLPSVFKQPVFLVVVLLLLAALAVLFFPGLPQKAPTEDVATQEAEQALPVVQSQPTEVLQATPVVAEPVAPATVVPVPVPMPALVAASAAVPVTSAAVGVAPDTKAASAVTAPPAGGQQVLFRVKGSSWVEVTDAKGAVLMRRNLAEGEAVGTSGALPLSVVVGRADVTEVEIKGKPFNLSPIAKDNVARFEVK
ncbi:helix-turn-helix domain-containing protein [uncultured Rhodoferax sp.]|uniref:helix-turn-helix domain-containing protein n=1 Tax=uncultured Rhodoferax sp. TaxID=223188 RepID=UPI002600A28A|nr:helix-turn-helix domain-containing protein [uncultured Rhodoferax sp.]